MRDYKNLKVWQLAHELVIEIYYISKILPESEKYRLTDQLLRASISIPNNLAEGCGRSSLKEFIRFIGIANGSTSEVNYLLILSRDLKYIDDKKYLYFNDKLDKIKRMNINLIKSIQKIM